MCDTLDQLIFSGLDSRDAARPAITQAETGQTISYGGLSRRVLQARDHLRCHLSDPESRSVIAVQLPNSVDFAVFFFGALAAGAAVTPISMHATAAETAHQIAATGAEVLVTTAGVARTGAAPVLADWPAGLGVIPFSSGTTGSPKPVALTHANLVANVRQMSAALDRNRMTKDWPIAAPLPFAHVYGLTVLLCTSLYRRNHLIAFARFDPRTFLPLHQKYQVAWSYVAPAILARIVRERLADGLDLTALKVVLSGADTLTAPLQQAAAAELGCEVVQGYGLSEASPVTHVNIRGYDDPATLGTPVDGTEVRVVDGELWVRGPQVMAGYLGLPAETAAAKDAQGWLRTGDVVELGPDGRGLRVIGRAKEIINHNGFQVSPTEVEERLREHPGISDAAVAAWQRSAGGEAPRAVVVPAAEGAVPSAHELASWVAARLAAYKVPVRFDVADAVPRTATGKVARMALRALGRDPS